jgi:uncharacterized membrane protein
LEQVVSFLFKYREAVFSKGHFSFGVRPPIIIALLVLAALCLLLYFLYSGRRSASPSRWRPVLVVFRSLLLAVILICLMRPVVVVPAVVPQSSFVAVLMDDSASMKIADEGGKSRLDAVKQALDPEGALIKGLSDKFKLRFFKFSDKTEPAGGPADLKGEGSETNLDASLNQAARELAGVPMSGVVLFTDGAQTAQADISSTLNYLRSRGIPVFTVGTGKPKLENDIEISRATAPRRVVIGSVVNAELLVRASGLPGRTARIDLTEDGHPFKSITAEINNGDGTQVVRMSFTPTRPGVHRYTFTAQQLEGETITDNNSQELLVNVEDRHPRILYVEGEPRWEYGRIRAAMEDEKNVILISLLRSADGKYYRQGVDSPDELAAGFPKSAEDLFKYDGLVIGSVESTFFSFEQLRNIEQFVSRRGGTLLALGGSKSFDAGAFSTTPLADLLPVYLTGQKVEEAESQAFHAMPSERGADYPMARLQEDRGANADVWQSMPAITLPEVLTATKPGATVILEARSIKQKSFTVPLLLEERYGRGRSMAFLASDTWRWRMMLEFKNKSFETFWRNMFRHMAQGVRGQVETTTERSSYGKGDRVQIRTEVGDSKYAAVTDAQVTARITAPSGQTTDLSLKPDVGRETEGYIGAMTPAEEGTYTVDVTGARGSKGEVLPSGRTEFVVGPVNREAFGAAQNRDLLKRIAAETGGSYYTVDGARDLPEDLSHAGGGNSVVTTLDLWDMPVNFILLVGLASAEWFVRKRKGMA